MYHHRFLFVYLYGVRCPCSCRMVFFYLVPVGLTTGWIVTSADNNVRVQSIDQKALGVVEGYRSGQAHHGECRCARPRNEVGRADHSFRLHSLKFLLLTSAALYSRQVVF